MNPQTWEQRKGSQRIEAVCTRCHRSTVLTLDALRKQQRRGGKTICRQCSGRLGVSRDEYRAYKAEYQRVSKRCARQDVLAWRADNNSAQWRKFEDWQQLRCEKEDYHSWWRERLSRSQILELATALSHLGPPDHSRPAGGRKRRITELDAIDEPLWNGRAPSQTPLKRKTSS